MKKQEQPEAGQKERNGVLGEAVGVILQVGWSRKASLHDLEAELSIGRRDQGKTEEEHFWLRNWQMLRAGTWLQVSEEMKTEV